MSVHPFSETWDQLNAPFLAGHTPAHDTLALLVSAYSEAQRYYHNQQHILDMLSLLRLHAAEIKDPATVAFAIFFHDAVYDVARQDNEAKSADMAVAYLQQTTFPAEKTALVKEYILATQTHRNPLQHTDLDYFLDADLRILGAPPAAYAAYATQIRREYHIYPDNIYHPGRRKVLQHFLDMPAIYRTPAFIAACETQARHNIQTELNSLNTSN
ncbi:hypothetical protein [Chitinophaga solisilvae]|uniref:HD domain-containing protein n=1 Tax=Chitinophaga solisilvae TaxID=1233460 RepID=UPI00136F3322|nr:hypothetical protein [Chitinophaga solisilvae]